jgi:hypothetical protein
MNDNRSLVQEAAALLVKARASMENADEQSVSTTQDSRRTKMEVETSTTTITAERAGELYTSGLTVDQIAKGNGITYARTKKLIVASGVTIRDASNRLKGRTRKSA